MNGAELPCGTVIQVEPASSEYKEVKHSHYGPQPSTQQQQQQEAATSTAVVEATAKEKQDDEKKVEEATEDLDDFFASLT